MTTACPAPERAQQICELFNELVGLDGASRSRRFDEVCADAAGLRREVESLLQAYARADAVLHRLEAPATGANGADPWQLTGKAVSHYQILERIGGAAWVSSTAPATRGCTAQSR